MRNSRSITAARFLRHTFVYASKGSVMTRLNAASVFVSRRVRLLLMAVVLIGCLKAGLSGATTQPQTVMQRSAPVHAGMDITPEMHAERAQSPDKD